MKAAITLALGLGILAFDASAQRRATLPTTPQQLLAQAAKHAPATARRGTSATVLRPGQEVRYTYDDQTSTWVDPEKVTFAYDAQGRTTRETVVDSLTSQNYFQTLTTYTPGGRLAEVIEQLGATTPGVNAWQDESREVYTYDARQELTGRQEQVAVLPSGWNTVAGERYVNVYNAANQLTQQTVQAFRPAPAPYADSLRYLYTRAAGGEWTMRTTQEANGNGGWTNVERQRAAVWNNYALGQLSSATVEEWTNGAWVTVARNVGTFTPTTTENAVQDSVAAGVYENSQRDFTRTDAFGNILDVSIDSWSGIAWEAIIALQYNYLYNPDNSIRTSLTRLDFFGSGLQLVARSNFSNYQTIMLGSRTLAASGATVQAYPNPSPDGRFTLALAAPTLPATIRVTDALGREVARTAWTAAPRSPQALDLSALPAGTYTLEVHTATGRSYQRLSIR